MVQPTSLRKSTNAYSHPAANVKELVDMYQAKGKSKDCEKLKNASPFLKEAAVRYPIITKQDPRTLRWQTTIFPENLEMENFLWNCLICTNIYLETLPIYRKVKEQYYEPPHALHLHWPIINILLYLHVHVLSLYIHILKLKIRFFSELFERKLLILWHFTPKTSACIS